MGMLSEFKAFAMKGNVVDMAVGIILGGAFGTIVSTLVDKVMMPPLGWAMGKVDFSKMSLKLPVGSADGTPVEMFYGEFVNAIIKFIIVAFCLFMIIKAMNTAMRKKEAAPPPPPGPTKDQQLLTEIRDLLARRG